jgi:hypothetical protein
VELLPVTAWGKDFDGQPIGEAREVAGPGDQDIGQAPDGLCEDLGVVRISAHVRRFIALRKDRCLSAKEGLRLDDGVPSHPHLLHQEAEAAARGTMQILLERASEEDGG